MIDIQQLTSLISAFRVETEKESISPETVGSISLLSSVMYQLKTSHVLRSLCSLRMSCSIIILALEIKAVVIATTVAITRSLFNINLTARIIQLKAAKQPQKYGKKPHVQL